MVNTPATETLERANPLANDRRGRGRAPLIQSNPLGQAKLNPFGDLHTLQHLSARLARPLRGVLEPMLREEVRTFAEPLVVQRFADYRAERPDKLTAWVPLAMAPNEGTALLVLDGRFVLELLDIFFGGTGAAPTDLPGEFSPAAEALIARLAGAITGVMKTSWEPVARLAFTPGRVEANASMLGGIDGEDAMIVTRFGIGRDTRKPAFVDLLYPVTALKPHGTALTGKVVAKGVEPDASWSNALTRAAMAVEFRVRSVLAEPVVPLSLLLNLKEGDVIPIIVSHDVPVMVGGDRFGAGTVGTSNGRAAIRLTQLTRTDEGLS